MTNLPYEANLNLRGGSLKSEISQTLSQTLGDVLGQVKQKTALSLGSPLNQVTFNQPNQVQPFRVDPIQVSNFYNSLLDSSFMGSGTRINTVV